MQLINSKIANKVLSILSVHLEKNDLYFAECQLSSYYVKCDIRFAFEITREHLLHIPIQKLRNTLPIVRKSILEDVGINIHYTLEEYKRSLKFSMDVPVEETDDEDIIKNALKSFLRQLKINEIC